MPLILIRKDITVLEVDAIVNAANESLLGGGGVDGAIHAAAGPELKEECRKLGGCRPGEAKLTRGYRLKAKYVIHTVGPRWQGGGSGEEAVLRACYRNSLALARDKGCETVAFPLISSGVFGYPKAEALAVAEEEIRSFLREEEMTVYLALFGHGPWSRDQYPELEALLRPAASPDAAQAAFGAAAQAAPASAAKERRGLGPFRRKTASEKLPGSPAGRPSPKEPEELWEEAPAFSEAEALPRPINAPKPLAFPDAMAGAAADESLEEALAALDESFSRMLLRKITEKGMTDAQCYKKANIDRKLFSKIRSDERYRPSKPTALAFAVALELALPETRELLMKAGFALSRSSKFDVIVEYYIRRGQYDIDRINEALFAFDQPLLGSL